MTPPEITDPGIVGLERQSKSAEVNAMFSRIAGRYDLMNSVMTGGLHHVWRAMAARIATDGPRPRILDVATGTGDFTWQLARRPGVSRVVGLDFVAPMIARAATKNRKRPRHADAVHFVVGDALRLPFADGSFDALTVGWGVRNFGDLDVGLGELHRVLRPGGRLVILEMTPPTGDGLAARAGAAWANQVVPLLGAITTRDAGAYRYLPESARAFPAADALVSRLQAAGFAYPRYRLVGLGQVAIHWADA